jgi:hypothetical protein
MSTTQGESIAAMVWYSRASISRARFADSPSPSITSSELTLSATFSAESAVVAR